MNQPTEESFTLLSKLKNSVALFGLTENHCNLWKTQALYFSVGIKCYIEPVWQNVTLSCIVQVSGEPLVCMDNSDEPHPHGHQSWSGWRLGHCTAESHMQCWPVLLQWLVLWPPQLPDWAPVSQLKIRLTWGREVTLLLEGKNIVTVMCCNWRRHQF